MCNGMGLFGGDEWVFVDEGETFFKGWVWGVAVNLEWSKETP